MPQAPGDDIIFDSTTGALDMDMDMDAGFSYARRLLPGRRGGEKRAGCLGGHTEVGL
jgi:hypothetical protein